MTNKDHPIKSGPNARKAVIIPLLVTQYGNIGEKLKSVPVSGKDMFGSFKELLISAKGLRKNMHKGNKNIDNDFAE